MQAPITVNYTPDGEDWTVTVNVTGESETRSARAAGLIAARDQADQLVEQLVPNDDGRTVVHLLEGDAYAFTTNYLHARLGLAEPGAAIPAQGVTATVPAQAAPDTTPIPTPLPEDSHPDDQEQAVTVVAEAPPWPAGNIESGSANTPADGAH